jgi:single-stranded-DNA-specific exonuclease
MCNGEKRYLLPSADAIVDPKQPDCPYPCKKICGAVVAWKLIGCLYPAMGIPRQEAGVFLENAAFATVGDVMELVEENRTIVALGLQQLSRTENPGMATLISRCGLEGRAISAYHVGFVLGPCFNASGRLDTAVRALELLEAENVRTAAPLAQQLQNLNEERKAMTEQGVKAGEAYITDHHLLQDTVLVVYLTGIHESVAGIIAGRLREKYSHPVFVLTDAADGRGLKGSGRSMEGYHMFDEICKCSDLMDKFGGHAMAAGLTLPRENLEAFRQRLNADPPLAPDELQPVIHIDVAMPLGYITKELVLQLEGLEPFGNGNSKPVFAQKDVRVRRRSRIGKNKEYLRMEVQDQSGCTMSALYFGDADALEAILDERGCFDMTYYPQINVFRGQESLQIVIGNVR